MEKKYQSNEWEIPKGRRKLHENNRICAMREFYEETNIKESSYKLYKNIIPIIEEYTGINNIRYKHVYYIGYIDTKCDVYIDDNNRDQCTEIKTIQWCSKEDCLKNIREYDKKKKDIIEKFFDYLDNYRKIIMIE